MQQALPTVATNGAAHRGGLAKPKLLLIGDVHEGKASVDDGTMERIKQQLAALPENLQFEVEATTDTSNLAALIAQHQPKAVMLYREGKRGAADDAMLNCTKIEDEFKAAAEAQQLPYVIRRNSGICHFGTHQHIHTNGEESLFRGMATYLRAMLSPEAGINNPQTAAWLKACTAMGDAAQVSH